MLEEPHTLSISRAAPAVFPAASPPRRSRVRLRSRKAIPETAEPGREAAVAFGEEQVAPRRWPALRAEPRKASSAPEMIEKNRSSLLQGNQEFHIDLSVSGEGKP